MSDVVEQKKEQPIECPICGHSKDWVNVDEYRLKPAGMAMCQKCGMVTYPGIIARNEELKEFYRKEYRPGPSVMNVYTGQRKMHKHASFLVELVDEWKKKKINPEIFEVGSAFGMFLKWMKDNFPSAKVSGSELTLTFRRVAFHEYGLQLVEDFDDSKCDLVASYKVLEHMAFPDRELRRYALALKENGRLYISVPTWFHTMSNFGTDGFTMEYYYDKNHVNVWTRKLFETLLKKCGLEIVKRDYVYYDSTYLCKRNDELMKEEPQFETPEKILELMSNIQKSAMAYDDGKFDEALGHFPAYPCAHIASYEKNRQAWHQKGFDAIEKEVIARALAACPESERITFLCADLCMRYDQVEKAMTYLQKCLEQNPADPAALIGLGHCYRGFAKHAKNATEEQHFLKQAREVMKHLAQVSMQHSQDSITWRFADEAKILMPSEVGGDAKN